MLLMPYAEYFNPFLLGLNTSVGLLGAAMLFVMVTRKYINYIQLLKRKQSRRASSSDMWILLFNGFLGLLFGGVGLIPGLVYFLISQHLKSIQKNRES